MALNEAKLHELVGKAVGDMGAVLTGALVVIGDKLGLYQALASAGPQNPKELAERTGTAERYVREWLSAQAAAGYVSYDPQAKRYFLSEEQAEAFANEESPFCVLGGFEAMTAATRAEPKVADAFRTGKGVGWHEHDPALFRGTERFFRPGYSANLVSSWIPALEGVKEKLEKGGKAADVGCGHGASTIIMAKGFPKSRFFGFDYHGPSIEAARKRAADAGVADRTTFGVASAKEIPAEGYDFVAFFDCLHDMGDPVGALRHVRSTVADDATVMIVEPFANDEVEQNLNPIGRIFYSASTMICTPASLSQEIGLALGAQAGEKRMRQVAKEAGFTRFRRATETPFNLIFEARP